MKKSSLPKQIVLIAIVTAYTLLAITYSVVTPLFEAPDELYHFQLVNYLATHWQLPVQPLTDPAKVGPWAQEGGQPPLAYFLAALVIAPIDRSDVAAISQPNPYAALGEVHADGSNLNVVIHHFARERFPWHGAVLAVHLARLLSIFYGICAIIFTWLLARELFPQQPWLANGAAAIHAFTPMFIYVSAAVNNDALLIPLCTLALWLLVRLVKTDRPRLRDFVYLGIVIGCALLTKTSALALLPFVAGVSLWAVWQTNLFTYQAGKRQAEIIQMALALGKYFLAWSLPLLLVAEWWYSRNLELYQDVLGLNVFLAIVGRRLYPPNFGQELLSLLQSYWGIFGWFNVPLPAWLYWLFNALLVIAGGGLLLQFYRWTQRVGRQADPWHWTALTIARVLVAMWPVAVLVALLRWTSLTPASQGRLLFPAISVLSLGLVGGLTGWLPAKLGRLRIYAKRQHVSLAVALCFLGVSLAAPFVWIQPAYRLPQPLAESALTEITQPLDVNFAGHLHLLGGSLDQSTIQPSEVLGFTLYWAGDKPTLTEHAVYIHVVGKEGRTVAQRDTLPGRGLLSTTAIQPGSIWQEHYMINLPPTAYAPDQLKLFIGVYEIKSGVRLAGEARVGKIALQPKATAPVLDVRFGQDLRLVNYQLNHLSIARGDSVTLTLTWQSLRVLQQNYTVSAQLINDNWQKAGQIDQAPSPPMTTWKVAQPNAVQYTLQIDPKTPPGLYAVRLAVYAKDADEQIQLLPVQWDASRMPTDNIVLTQIRID
ncbi:MAG: glycosyltransferase family 39 protein [Caldilineaceae bacterium]